MANVTWNRHRDARGRAIFIIYKEIAGTLLILCHCRPMKRLWRNRSRFAAHRQQPLPRVQQFPFARIPPPPPRPIFGKAPNRRSIPPEFRDQRRARKSADSKAPATSPGFRVIDPISDELSSSRRGRGRIENFFFLFFLLQRIDARMKLIPRRRTTPILPFVRCDKNASRSIRINLTRICRFEYSHSLQKGIQEANVMYYCRSHRG